MRESLSPPPKPVGFDLFRIPFKAQTLAHSLQVGSYPILPARTLLPTPLEGKKASGGVMAISTHERKSTLLATVLSLPCLKPPEGHCRLCFPPNYVQVPIPDTCECDLRDGLYRGHWIRKRPLD